MSDTAQPPAPKFDPSAQHHQRPRLRPVRAFPAKFGEHTVMGLADGRQISDKVVWTAPAFQNVLHLLDGSKTISEIVSAVGGGLTAEPLEMLVAQLDEAALLYGPKFDAVVKKMRADFDGAPNLPPGSTAAFIEALAEHTVRMERPEAERAAPVEMTPEARDELGTRKFREVLDMWIEQSLKDANAPVLDATPKAIVVPHIDYQRGWINYASVWGRLRSTERPDRVVILGTNHFGEGTGVCACDKGFIAPFGVCEADKQLISLLRDTLGAVESEKLFANRYDHEREHSVELQIPWIQHCLGKDEDGNYPKVFGALIHDPTVNNGDSYDGNGVSFDTFVNAMKKVLAQLPGRTLIVSSADLSHVGVAFGDQSSVAGSEPAAEEFRQKTFNHDREMIQLYAEGKIDELIASMSWQQNPTRWCSIGNMCAAYRIADPSKVNVYNYTAAVDEQSHSLVSSIGIAMQ